jgi:hypothetical protein
MPLDPAFGFAMVVIFLEDWIVVVVVAHRAVAIIVVVVARRAIAIDVIAFRRTL